jgi:hypothetical protein
MDPAVLDTALKRFEPTVDLVMLHQAELALETGVA